MNIADFVMLMITPVGGVIVALAVYWMAGGGKPPRPADPDASVRR